MHFVFYKKSLLAVMIYLSAGKVADFVNFACAKRTFATMCKRLEVFSRIHMSASAYFVDFGKRLPISTESQNRIRYRRGSSNVWEGVQPALQPASWTAGSQRRYGGRQFEITGEALQVECPSVILRHDLPEVVDPMTVDCHRPA